MAKDIFAVAGALLVFLTVVEALWPKSVFPLGGSEIAQTGIVLGLAFVVIEIAGVLSQWR